MLVPTNTRPPWNGKLMTCVSGPGAVESSCVETPAATSVSETERTLHGQANPAILPPCHTTFRSCWTTGTRHVVGIGRKVATPISSRQALQVTLNLFLSQNLQIFIRTFCDSGGSSSSPRHLWKTKRERYEYEHLDTTVWLLLADVATLWVVSYNE